MSVTSGASMKNSKARTGEWDHALNGIATRAYVIWIQKLAWSVSMIGIIARKEPEDEYEDEEEP
jgi:hypothetical protein